MQEFGIDIGSNQCIISTINNDYVETLLDQCPNICLIEDGKRVFKSSSQCFVSSNQSMIKLTKKLPDFSRATRILHNGALRDLPPEQSLSQFLSRCKEIIDNSKYSPSAPYPLAITVPSHFDHSMRSIYVNAVSFIHEFQLQAIVNENTALAVAYGVEALNILETPAHSKYVLFVDSGCQTTVTLVYYNNFEIQVLYSAHNPVISGDTVNDIIYTEILGQLKADRVLVAPTFKQKLQLLAYAEQVKIALNTAGTTSTSILLDKVDKMEPYLLKFTRERFNEAIEATHMETFLIDLLNSVISNSGVKEFSKNNLSQIVLFGGNMRTYFLINAIKSSFKCPIEVEWNSPNRICEGLMYFMYSRDMIQVYELLHEPSVFDMSKFNCDYLKVSQYIKCYMLEEELRKINVNRATKKGGSVGVTYPKTPGGRNFYAPKLVDRGPTKPTSATKITQSKVVTVDDEYPEDIINIVQEKIDKMKQLQDERAKQLSKEERCSDVLKRLLNKKNRICLKFEQPRKKDPNSPFLFDSVFAESYKEETELSRYLQYKGDVYEHTDEYKETHIRKPRHLTENVKFQSNVMEKIEQINTDQTKRPLKQQLLSNLDSIYQIKPPVERKKRREAKSLNATKPQKPSMNYSLNPGSARDSQRRTKTQYLDLLSRLKEIKSILYTSYRLLEFDRFMESYYKAADYPAVNYDKIVEVLVNDLLRKFFVIGFVIDNNLIPSDAVDQVFRFIHDLKGHRVQIQQYYVQHMTKATFYQKVDLLEQYAMGHEEILLEYDEFRRSR